MARKESEFDSNSDQNRSSSSKRKWNHQDETRSNPSTSRNHLAASIQHFVKKASDPNKWTSIQSNTSNRDRDRVGYSKDGRSATKARGASAIPQTASRRHDDANSRVGYPPTSYQHFSSPGPGSMSSSRSYHPGGEDAYRQPDPRFKPPPPPMAQMMAPPFSRAPSLNRPESAIATPPPSNLGSSPFQTRGQPPIMGPPTFLGDRGRSTSSSHYPPTSILPSWNPHINPQVYPRPPPSVSSSSNSSYHHRQTSTTPFSSRFHPAHPLARSTSIQPGGGIGNPYGPPSLGGGLPFAASMGTGAFGGSFSVRSGSTAPSNRSRNTTTSTVRNRKSLPKSDWDNLMGMMRDSKNEEKEKGLEKEREKQRAREGELRLERLEKEKSPALESNRQDQVLEAVEDATTEAPSSSTKNPIQPEESFEEEEQAFEENSNLPSNAAEHLQDEIVQEASSIKPKSSSKKSSFLKDQSSNSNIDPIFLKDDSQLRPSTSQVANSTPPKVIKCPSLSSWYLCHAPVRSVPVEVLKSHPHASTLKSWVHLQGFRIGGDQNGNVWKSSAIISRLPLEAEEGSHSNVVYSSEASEQLKLNELQRIKQEEEEEIKEKELKTLVSRFSTASGKVYEVRGRSTEKEMNQRGFKNCLKVLQDHSIDLDHESSDGIQVNQVWPENEVWIEAVIQDLIEIEKKIAEKKIEKKKIKRESMKSKEVVEVEEGDEQAAEKAETSGILNDDSPISSLGLKRKRKPSSKVEENLEIENTKMNESRPSRKSSSQSQDGKADVNSTARRARRSSPLKTRSRSENTTAEADGDGKSRKKKKRNSEVEHDFELIIPVYRRKSESSLSRKKSRSVVDDEESRADEVEEEAERQAEGIEIREENQEEENEPHQSPQAGLESEDFNQDQEEVPENQESLEQIEQVAKEQFNADEPEPQPEMMELDMEMPPLDDQPEIEDEGLETEVREAAAEPLQDLDFHEQEEEEPEMEEAPIQTTIEESSDEEVAGALFEDQDQEDENSNPIPSRSVDADEFEASPNSFASSPRRASTSKSSSKAIKPKLKPKQSRNSDGDLLNSSTSKPFKPKKPRASAPSTSISKSSSEPFSVAGQTTINRELAALTKSRFGTFNFLKPVNLVARAVENEEEPEDEEMEEIRRMEREIMNSSQERPSSNVKPNRKPSKGTSNSNGKGKKKSRKSLPVTTRELQQIRSSSTSSSSSRSDSVEPSLDVVPSTSFRSSTRTRVTSRPREWWKVNEDTFKSPLARSHESSSLKRSPKKIRNVKRNRKVMESDESDEEIEGNDASSEENQTPKKKTIKRVKPSRIATDSPSNSETEPKSKKNQASTSKEKKAKKQIGSASLTYSRKGSRSPVKKAGSSSFPIEEFGSDAYVFSD